MPYELNEIKNIRRKIGLTQNELAKRANVSQSLIAKIESGRLDPSYSNAKKIIDALSSITKKQELKAEQIMNKKIIFVSPNEAIKDVIQKLKKYEISQLPVVEDNKCVGLVSESILLDSIINKKGKNVKDIMEEAPPIISKDASIDVISNLLKFYPIILVASGGRYEGIITKADMLLKIYKK
jgi:predicted transcriptional regulator